MKQLTILCSSDLSDRVQAALTGAGLEGFVQLPGGCGYKPAAAAPRGDTPHWPAEVWIATADDERAQAVVDSLAAYAGRCDVAPCLRILISDLTEIR